MLFSVVVPTHHRPHSLASLLQSLEKQSLPATDFEVIVVPSPQDKSLSWLQDYSSRAPFKITVHIPEADPFQGRSASFKRNQGVGRAQADWIAFVDDDCVADPHWLTSAATLIDDPSIHGIEGLTRIPQPPQITLTYKGLTRLSSPGGYQTCNMFYRKKTFQEVGGFDLQFPFYLEDTDLAWSILDRDYVILFLDTAIVEHPVPPAETKRLLDNAWRTRLIPYLYKKHPALFAASGFKPLGRAHWIYLYVYAGSLYSIWMRPTWSTGLLMLALIVGLNSLYIGKLLQGCGFSRQELKELFLYMPLAPVISFFQLLRGNFEQRTWIIFNR